MNKTTILIVGEEENTGSRLFNLVNSQTDWKVVKASTAEDAIEKFHQLEVDVVILNDNHPEQKKLHTLFRFQHPDIIIINPGNDAALIEEITTAVNNRIKETGTAYSFIDDALKNAMLPIIVQ